MAGIEKQITETNKLKDYLNTLNEYEKAHAKYLEKQRPLREKVIQLMAEQKQLMDAIRALESESRNSLAPDATQPRHKNLNDGDRLPRPGKRGIQIARLTATHLPNSQAPAPNPPKK